MLPTACRANPYDGHTLGAVVDATEKLTGRPIERAYIDKGYRGHGTVNPRRIFISGRGARPSDPSPGSPPRVWALVFSDPKPPTVTALAKIGKASSRCAGRFQGYGGRRWDRRIMASEAALPGKPQGRQKLV